MNNSKIEVEKRRKEQALNKRPKKLARVREVEKDEKA
jgi:hypothetical protein